MPRWLSCWRAFIPGIFSCYQPRVWGQSAPQRNSAVAKLHSQQSHREEPNDWICCFELRLFFKRAPARRQHTKDTKSQDHEEVTDPTDKHPAYIWWKLVNLRCLMKSNKLCNYAIIQYDIHINKSLVFLGRRWFLCHRVTMYSVTRNYLLWLLTNPWAHQRKGRQIGASPKQATWCITDFWYWTFVQYIRFVTFHGNMTL